MNRITSGIALLLVCGSLPAADPATNSAPAGKLDRRSPPMSEFRADTSKGTADPEADSPRPTQLAPGVYTPAPGSPERAAIMDAIRGPVVEMLRQPVIFKAAYLRVRDEWAFIKAEPRRPDGSQIDYRRTRFAEAYAAGAFDPSVLALLKRNGATWQVVDSTFGATDLPYGDWWKKYGAPKSIFDYVEP